MLLQIKEMLMGDIICSIPSNRSTIVFSQFVEQFVKYFVNNFSAFAYDNI